MSCERRRWPRPPCLSILWLCVCALSCEDQAGVAVMTDPSGVESAGGDPLAGEGAGGEDPSTLDLGLTDQEPGQAPSDLGALDMGGMDSGGVESGGLQAGEEGGGGAGGEAPDPNIELEQWLESCALSPSPLLERASGLYDQSVAEVLRLGGPLSSAALYAVNPSGADPSALSYLTLQGGRLERHSLGGQLLWVSDARGLTHIMGVWDLNGDGALEVVSRGLRHVYVASLSSGRTTWRSPDQLNPDGAEVSTLGLVRAFERDDQVRLYIADSGCGSAGSGDGALFSFTGSLSAPERTSFRASDRFAGRCPSQHSYHRGETREGVMMLDSQGLHLFDAQSGSRALCGAIADLPSQGNTFIAALELAGEPAWLLTTPTELILVQEAALDPQRAAHCPSSAPTALLPTWRHASPGLTRSALTVIDLEGDGAPELLTSSVDERGWRTELLSAETGALIASTFNHVVLGALPTGDGLPLLLVAERAADTRDSDPQRVTLMALDVEALSASSGATLTFTPRWSEALEGITPLYQGAPPDWSTAHRRLALFSTEDGARLVLRQRIQSAQGDGLERLLMVGPEGVEALLEEGGPWRAMMGSCALEGCAQPDLITLAGHEGLIRSYTVDLTPISEQGLAQPTGATALAWSGDQLITRNEAGELSALRPPRAPSDPWELNWRVYMGRSNEALSPPTLPSSSEQPEVVVTPSGLDPLRVSWEGRSLSDGAPRWSHSLPRAQWRPMSEAISGEPAPDMTYLYRHERMESPEAVADLNMERCERAWLYSDLTEGSSLELPLTTEDSRLFAQRPECPNRPMRPQVIHALDARDGRCVWVAVIRATDDCYGPSGQAISFVEGAGGAEPSLYLTETEAVRRFNPLTGELISRQLIEESPVGQRRGGGRVTAAAGGVMRFGGNGPPELYPFIIGEAQAGETTWRVGQWEGLRDQSWVYRPALGDEGGAWVSVGASLPLARLNADGTLGELISFQGSLTEELPPVAGLPLTAHMTRGEELRRLSRDPNGALVVGTLEGGHYVIDDHQSPIHLNRYELLDAPMSGLLWVDWDQDGRLERLLAHSGGEVLIYQHSGLEAPAELWVARCEGPARCEGDSASEERPRGPLNRSDALCYAWRPLEGLSGAEVQLRDEGGAALTEWVEAPLTGRGVLRDLSLVQGAQYLLALRAWVDRPEGREYTGEARSQLVSFEDITPPVVHLTALDGRVSLGQGSEPLQLTLEASDDVSLTGWSANVYSSSGVRVQSLGRGSLSAQVFTRALTWDGTNADELRLPTGTYEVRANVIDSSAQSGSSSLVVQIE